MIPGGGGNGSVVGRSIVGVIICGIIVTGGMSGGGGTTGGGGISGTGGVVGSGNSGTNGNSSSTPAPVYNVTNPVNGMMWSRVSSSPWIMNLYHSMSGLPGASSNGGK